MIVLIFTIILTAIFYQKKMKETAEHSIYEEIDMPPVPPQLPPRQPHQIPMELNPLYVHVGLIVNPSYTSIKNDTVINSASDALVAVSHEEEKYGDDMTGGYEEVAESTELTNADDTKADDGQQGSYVELGTAEDSLPLPTMDPMLNTIVSDYDKLKLPSTDLLKSTLTPVCTAVSATNLTFDSVQEEKSSTLHLMISASEKKTLRNAQSATDIRSMGDHNRPS